MKTKLHPFQVIPVRAPKIERGRNRVFNVFRVRHGYIDLVKTEGCTDDDKEGVTPINISVPSRASRHVIWIESRIEKNRARKNVLCHGPNGWPDFPNQSNTAGGIYYTPVAEVSTTGERPKVRAFTRSDVNLNLEWLAHLKSLGE